MEAREINEELLNIQERIGFITFRIRNPESYNTEMLANMEMKELEKAVSNLRTLYINAVKERERDYESN